MSFAEVLLKYKKPLKFIALFCFIAGIAGRVHIFYKDKSRVEAQYNKDLESVSKQITENKLSKALATIKELQKQTADKKKHLILISLKHDIYLATQNTKLASEEEQKALQLLNTVAKDSPIKKQLCPKFGC